MTTFLNMASLFVSLAGLHLYSLILSLAEILILFILVHDNEDKAKENKNWTEDKILLNTPTFCTSTDKVCMTATVSRNLQKPKENNAVQPLIGTFILRNGLNSDRPKITELTEWLPWTCLCDFDCIQWSQQIKNSSTRLVNYWSE